MKKLGLWPALSGLIRQLKRNKTLENRFWPRTTIFHNYSTWHGNSTETCSIWNKNGVVGQACDCGKSPTPAAGTPKQSQVVCQHWITKVGNVVLNYGNNVSLNHYIFERLRLCVKYCPTGGHGRWHSHWISTVAPKMAVISWKLCYVCKAPYFTLLERQTGTTWEYRHIELPNKSTKHLLQPQFYE